MWAPVPPESLALLSTVASSYQLLHLDSTTSLIYIHDTFVS